MILRSRRTGSPVDVERVWTEIRALATDYGQSLDPSRTLRHDELVLAGGSGYGDPAARNPEAAARDLALGYVTPPGTGQTPARTPQERKDTLSGATLSPQEGSN